MAEEESHHDDLISSKKLAANRFRTALQLGRPLVGIWSMLNSTNVTEGFGWAGFDWLLIDGEHAPVSLDNAISHMRALKGTPTVPIVRLAWNDRILLKQHLDAGADVIMLPYVQNAAEAASAVTFMRYPPLGTRGVAAIHRASRYGQIPDYLERANEELVLIVQVETHEALDKVDEIANVEGVDAIFFGPGDLAASMGMLGQAGDPAVTAKINKAMSVVHNSGKKAGVLAPNPTIAAQHIEAGFDFVSVANDAAILFGSARAIAENFQSLARK